MSDRAKPETFMLQDFVIDLDQHRVSVAGRIGALAATDYDLLCVLSLNPPLSANITEWTLLTKVETSCDRILIAGGANVEAEWEQGPAV